MAIRKKDIYHGRNPVKTAFKVLGIVLAALVVLAVIVFFWFKRYIVYTDDGQLRLEVPFIQREGS